MTAAAARAPDLAVCRFCGARILRRSRAIGDHLETHIKAGKIKPADKFKEKLEMAGAEIKAQYAALFKAPVNPAKTDPIKQEPRTVNRKTFDLPVLIGMNLKDAEKFVSSHNRILMDVNEDKQREKRGIRDLVLNRIVVRTDKNKIIEIVRLG